MTWLEDAARAPVADVAERLGMEVRRHASSSSCRCPACGVERRHPGRRDRRGSVGVPHARPATWRCFCCDAGGDSVDFAGFALCGARFRDLSPDQRAEIRSWFGGGSTVVWQPPRPAQPLAPLYPPQAELEAFWAACRPVNELRCAREYLSFRGIDARAVARRDLARALPRDADLPEWAHLGRRTWIESWHRLIVPLFDAQGCMRSVLARSVERSPSLKSAGARGFQRGGLVMADRIGRGLLEHGRAPRWWPEGRPFEVTIREGEIDLLQEATSRNDELAPAVVSVVSGSWSTAIAQRIPAGSHVTIATDDDAAGDKYASAIAATLEGRSMISRRRNCPHGHASGITNLRSVDVLK